MPPGRRLSRYSCESPADSRLSQRRVVLENATMLDATRDVITPVDLEVLKSRPDAAIPERWIPLLVAEVERLREQLRERDNAIRPT